MNDERLDQILAVLQELQLSLEGLRGTVRGAIKVADDHEERLRTVERWQNRMSPVLALGTFVGGVMFQVAMSKWMAM
ncbi:MAG: hypothetical protein U0903_18095 [Planctomycetales bacterium]